MSLKFIITADLHQDIRKWEQLVRAVKREKPRFVLVAGDILPKDGGFTGQRSFFSALADYLAAMRSSAQATILTFFGNDDFHPLEPLLDDLAAKGLCVNLGGKVHREGGLVFCGVNYVRDYPFGYKHWCAPDGDFIACPIQFCGEGLTLDAKGRWIELPNLWNTCWPSSASTTGWKPSGRSLRQMKSIAAFGSSTIRPPILAWTFAATVAKSAPRPSYGSSTTNNRCSAVVATFTNHPASRGEGGRRELGKRSGSSRGRRVWSFTTSVWRSPTISASTPAVTAFLGSPRSERECCQCHVTCLNCS